MSVSVMVERKGQIVLTISLILYRQFCWFTFSGVSFNVIVIIVFQIQHSVRNTVRGQGSEQIPVTISTFTNGRKLYLSPGVDMRNVDHPDSFTSKELPPPDSQRIQLNWRGILLICWCLINPNSSATPMRYRI